MLLPDVNVLVYAHREEVPRHDEYRAWVEAMADGPARFMLSNLVLSGFIRVVTHRRIFDPPSTLAEARSFVADLRQRPQRVTVGPGPRHWQIFTNLCDAVEAKGNLVPDAYHAALAIESGSEWITTDRGFARFPGLRWRHPLEQR